MTQAETSEMAAPRRSLADLLFRSRELLLRHLVDPFDGLCLRASGRGDWPPYSLRRHVGSPAKFALAARQTEEWLDRFGLLAPGISQVLDLGCGCGSMAPVFARRLAADTRYLGFDVHPPSIAFCRRAFAGDERFRFALAEVASPYGGQAGKAAEGYDFPLPSGSTDLVLAKSVFTHLREPTARRYLNEIARVLKPEGQALVSAFLFTLPPSAELLEGLPCPPGREAKNRWRIAARPEAAIGFEGEQFLSWVAQAGLAVEHFVPIFWPGKSSVNAGQDLLVLRRSAP